MNSNSLTERDILNDHSSRKRNIALSEFDNDKMILFVPEHFWVSILKFNADHATCSKLVIGAWWKYLKRLLLLSYKSWMLFVMSIALLIRMPEAYAINVTVKTATVSLTSSYDAAAAAAAAVMVLPTANLVSLLKSKKPISVSENEVIITSADAEDYLEDDDSDEDDYDDVRKDNGSGKCVVSSCTQHTRLLSET